MEYQHLWDVKLPLGTHIWTNVLSSCDAHILTMWKHQIVKISKGSIHTWTWSPVLFLGEAAEDGDMNWKIFMIWFM
jgi:hypothetical protein